MQTKNQLEQEFKIKYYGGEEILSAESTRLAVEKFEKEHPEKKMYAAGPVKHEPRPTNMDDIDIPYPF